MCNFTNLRESILCLLLSVLLFNLWCQKSEFIEPTGYNLSQEIETSNNESVDNTFDIYVDRFIAEGAQRGFDIDLGSRNVTIQFTNINQSSSPNIVGLCTYNNHNLNDISIDSGYWNQASDLGREFVLFHELGHCYLQHAHRNDAFSNCICKSLYAWRWTGFMFRCLQCWKPGILPGWIVQRGWR